MEQGGLLIGSKDEIGWVMVVILVDVARVEVSVGQGCCLSMELMAQ